MGERKTESGGLHGMNGADHVSIALEDVAFVYNALAQPASPLQPPYCVDIA